MASRVLWQCKWERNSVRRSLVGDYQYRKASGYSGIKAALRCSSATRLTHKHLNASRHSFVHGLHGRIKAFEVLRNDWEDPQYE